MPKATRKDASVEISNRKIPKRFTKHFREALHSHETLMKIIHISERGIGVLRGIPKVVKVLADIHGKGEHPSTAKELAKAESHAALAATEIAKDFPVLHGLAVAALWSWLEHLVKGFLALWILDRHDAVHVAAVQRLRVKIGDYLQLQKVDQAYFLVNLLEQDLASPLKRGANRFESLLEPFGLSGPLPEGCAQKIFELQQIRNAIVHRNGLADRKLKVDCPTLKLRLNHPVHISRAMLKEYSEASLSLLIAILYRVGDRYGVDLRSKTERNDKAAVEKG